MTGVAAIAVHHRVSALPAKAGSVSM